MRLNQFSRLKNLCWIYRSRIKHYGFHYNFIKKHFDAEFFDEANKKVIEKMKDMSEGKIIDEFVGLKSKIYSIKNIDGEESNTAKRVYIETEFNEFKDTFLIKKQSDIK